MKLKYKRPLERGHKYKPNPEWKSAPLEIKFFYLESRPIKIGPAPKTLWPIPQLVS